MLFRSDPGSLRSRTVVVRCADHGEMGLSHGGLRQKAFNAYEETIHIPLVISNPVLFPERSETDALQRRYDDESNPPIVGAVQQVAEARGVPMAQVALAWVLRNPVVAAPIVGPTKVEHLTDAVAAVDLELTDDEAAALEAPYTPRLPSGFA